MFGIQMQDILMQGRIEQHGLTVAEASQMRRQGALPIELAKAWDEYDAWLLEQRHRTQDGHEDR